MVCAHKVWVVPLVPSLSKGDLSWFMPFDQLRANEGHVSSQPLCALTKNAKRQSHILRALSIEIRHMIQVCGLSLGHSQGIPIISATKTEYYHNRIYTVDQYKPAGNPIIILQHISQPIAPRSSRNNLAGAKRRSHPTTTFLPVQNEGSPRMPFPAAASGNGLKCEKTGYLWRFKNG